jgi:hypothetical protein
MGFSRQSPRRELLQHHFLGTSLASCVASCPGALIPLNQNWMVLRRLNFPCYVA